MKKFLALATLFGLAKSETVTLGTESYNRNSAGGDNSPRTANDCPNDLVGNVCGLNNVPTLSGNTFTFQQKSILRTQMLPQSQLPQDSNAAQDSSTMKDVAPGTTEESRFIQMTVTMDLSSDTHRYESCGVKLAGGELQNVASFVTMYGHNPGLPNTEIGTDNAKVIFNNLNPQGPSCTFMLANNMFVGSLDVEVLFQTPDNNKIDNKDRVRTVMVPITYSPHSTDGDFKHAMDQNFIPSTGVAGSGKFSQNNFLRDVIISHTDYCSKGSDGYFLQDKPLAGCGGEQTNDNPSTAVGGSVNLRVSGIFLDQRYKVNGQEGVNTLKTGIGNIEITKVGLLLDDKYLSFNDGDNDKDSEGGDDTILLQPIAYANRRSGHTSLDHQRTGDSSLLDYSNEGIVEIDGVASAPLLNYTSDITSSNVAEDPLSPLSSADIVAAYQCSGQDGCYAQYQFSHTFNFVFAELPPFKNKYIKQCTECPDRLNIQMFKDSGAHMVDVSVSVNVDDLPEDAADYVVQYPDLTPHDILRLPGDIRLSELFSVSTGTNPNARSTYADLDAQISADVLAKFVFSAKDQLENSANAMQITEGKCALLTDLYLYELELDIAEAFQKIFEHATDCKVTVPSQFYGTVHTIMYQPKNTLASSGTGATYYAYLTVIDDRKIRMDKTAGTSLSLATRTSLDMNRVATTISFQFSKDYPDGVSVPTNFQQVGALNLQRVVYRLHGDSESMAGFVNDVNGGGECAGNNMYWRPAASRDDRRIYKEVWSNSKTAISNTVFDDESVYEQGKPYGTCKDVPSDKAFPSGFNVLGSITQNQCNTANGIWIEEHSRCLGGDNHGEGSLVRYRKCKIHGGTWQIVSLPDASLADNTCTGDACGSSLSATTQCTLGTCDYIQESDKCLLPAIQEEVLLITDQTDNAKVDHFITSTDRCTGNLGLQVEDTTKYQEFAIYKVNTECSRMSSSNIQDKLDLKYEFTALLKLETNEFGVTATPTSPTLDDTANSHEVICPGNDLSDTPPKVCTTKDSCVTDCGSTGPFNSTYSVQAFFGSCNPSTNAIDTSNVHSHGACQSYMSTTNGWTSDAIKFSAQSSDSDGIEALRACALSNNGVDVTIDDNYIVEFEMGMQYTRKLYYDPSHEIKYCDSQIFVSTINRKATGTVTTADIAAAGLNRAVYVKDIGWTQDDCATSGSDYYRLEVLLVSKDQDSRDASYGASSWKDSKLTAAFIDSAPTAQNAMNFAVHADSSTGYTILDTVVKTVEDGASSANRFQSEDDRFQIRGQCIQIQDCTANTAWDTHSQEFQTDLVIRGVFQLKSIDTRVKVTVKFEECPINAAAADTGQTFIGLYSECTAPLNAQNFLSQSVAQPDTDSYLTDASDSTVIADLKYDCTEAYADDVLRVDANLFAVGDSCTVEKTYHDDTTNFDPDCKLDETGRAEAEVDQQWSVDQMDIFIDRKRKDASGNDFLVSETKICRCNAGTGNCQIENNQIPGLTAFTQAAQVAGKNQFEHFLACGTLWDKIVASDVTDAQKNAIAAADGVGNNKTQVQIPLFPLSDAPDDEFVVRYEAVLYSNILESRRRLRATHKINLRNSLTAEGSTHGVKVVQLSSEAYTEEAPAQSSSEAPAAVKNDSTSSTTSTSSSMSTGAIVSIVVGSIAAALLILQLTCGIFTNCNWCAGSGSGSAEERTAFVGGGVRENRFDNLRY